MSIDTEKAHDGMIMCVKCGSSSLLEMVNMKLVAHITVKRLSKKPCNSHGMISNDNVLYKKDVIIVVIKVK